MKDSVLDKLKRFSGQESVVTITAGKYVYLENCRRILEYNDIRIAVQLSDSQLHIWGSQLLADCYEPSTLVVYGNIQSLEWIGKGGKSSELSSEKHTV